MTIPTRFLVTGGAGFIGSHLCEALLRAGHSVICLDDFSTGRPENLQSLRDSPRFTLVEHDVISPYDVEVDGIYNLACPASPKHYQRDPSRTLDTCFLGMRNALELARRRDIPVLQTSTSEVYGDPEEHPQHEEYWGHVNPWGPRACYDEGKRVAESLCLAYAEQYGVQVRIARIFNTYGSRMRRDDGRVVPAFIWQALSNQALTVFGDGRQTRSFCHVDDLVRGLLALMSHPSANHRPVNLGNPAELSVRVFAERVIALTGSRSVVVERPLPIDDPRRRCPDITRAKTLLDWQPRISLDEGLRRTIAWFVKQRSAPDGGARTGRTPTRSPTWSEA